MCGITGYWSLQGPSQDMAADLRRAVACLAYRGPDDNGTWTNDAGVGLGHTRLAILDLSDEGHQPITTADGSCTMVFNGEIYNFPDVRKRLIDKGYTFTGTGDTGVVLAALQEWGPQAVDQFIGMFTIAYWDERHQRLTLIRDRVGIKPLYYGWDGTTFWFGSEMKAMRVYRHWSPQINMHAVGEYLQYGYISGTRSIFDRVHKLQPGHYLTLERGSEPVETRYWSVVGDGTPYDKSDDEAEAEVEALLVDACKYRMVSDVPVGVYLSGGVDSSVVTAMLAQELERPIKTFTIGFKEAERDESVWAKKVAHHLGTDHTEYILEVKEALGIARTWGDLFDEPFADASGIPTLLVSRLASEAVKVVLSADGGDELFSGYAVYDAVLDRSDKIDSVPGWARSAVGTGLRGIPVGALDRVMSGVSVPTATRAEISRKIRRLRAMLADASSAKVFDTTISYWLPDEVRTMIGGYDRSRPLADSYDGTIAEQMCLWDFHHYLPEDILTKVDRTTMAVSIEGRVPMLDHRVAELAFKLPLHLRRGELGPKHLLKKILYRRIPREMVDRPKQGFMIPLDSWLRRDLKELVGDYLSRDRLARAGILNPDAVTRAVDEFYAGHERLTMPVWFLLAFEMWRERWG